MNPRAVYSGRRDRTRRTPDTAVALVAIASGRSRRYKSRVPARPLLALPFLVLAQFGETPNEAAAKAGRVGITLDKRGEVLVVSAVDAGSAAESAGLKIGDQVLRIDLDDTAPYSTSDAAAALRGVHGSRVTLTVLPRAAMMPRRVDVVRDVRVYLAHDASSKMDPAEVKEAIASVTRDPASAPRTLTATLSSVSQKGTNMAREDVRGALQGSGADVATCIGALRDVLPAGFPAEFAADFTVKRGAISVRTEPPSGDLASCLGKQAARWELPEPKKKQPPIVFRAVWAWNEE